MILDKLENLWNCFAPGKNIVCRCLSHLFLNRWIILVKLKHLANAYSERRTMCTQTFTSSTIVLDGKRPNSYVVNQPHDGLFRVISTCILHAFEELVILICTGRSLMLWYVHPRMTFSGWCTSYVDSKVYLADSLHAHESYRRKSRPEVRLDYLLCSRHMHGSLQVHSYMHLV